LPLVFVWVNGGVSGNFPGSTEWDGLLRIGGRAAASQADGSTINVENSDTTIGRMIIHTLGIQPDQDGDNTKP